MVRHRRLLSAWARAITSSSVGISNCPSKRVFCGRTAGSRSFARRVFSSARVKSSVNQPVTDTPSITLVVRRAANSGLVDTSVVPRDLVLVAGHQAAVPGDHQVRLDEVGAQLDGQLVGGQGVLGAVAAGPAVADDDGLARALALAVVVGLGRARRWTGRRRGRRSARPGEYEHATWLSSSSFVLPAGSAAALRGMGGGGGRALGQHPGQIPRLAERGAEHRHLPGALRPADQDLTTGTERGAGRRQEMHASSKDRLAAVNACPLWYPISPHRWVPSQTPLRDSAHSAGRTRSAVARTRTSTTLVARSDRHRPWHRRIE